MAPASTTALAEDLRRLNELLHEHTGDADHGQAAVVELLGLHGGERVIVGGLDAEGVEAEVPRGVVSLQASLAGDGAGLRERLGDRLVLNEGHAQESDSPELCAKTKAHATSLTRGRTNLSTLFECRFSL